MGVVSTKSKLDSLPKLSPREAYLAMYEFLRIEFELTGNQPEIHLGGLLAEMEPEADGSTSDPGAAETFVDAIEKVLGSNYKSVWRDK